MTELHPSVGLSPTRAAQPEQGVFDAWQQHHDPVAAELILRTYARFLSSEVRPYGHHPDALPDLEQDGRLSILDHARTYRSAAETGDASFLGYFKQGVSGDICYAYLRSLGVVNVPSLALARYMPIIGEQRRRETANESPLTEDEVAKLLDIPARGPAIVKNTIALVTATDLLHSITVWQADRQGDLPPDEWESARIITDRNDYPTSTEEAVLDNMEFANMFTLLDKAFEPEPNTAPEEAKKLARQRIILMQRLGLTDGVIRSFVEIAECHKLGDSRVGQIYAEAIARLQTFAFEQGVRPTPPNKSEKARTAQPGTPSSQRGPDAAAAQFKIARAYPKKW